MTQSQPPLEFAVDIESAEKLMVIEEQLHDLNVQFNAEQLALEQKYKLLKEPIFQTRDTESESVPNFWSTALCNNAFLQSLAFPTEMALLSKLEKIQVVRSGIRDFKLLFTFAKNDCFEDSVLVKSVMFDEENDASVVPATIKWMKGKRFFTPKKSAKQHDHSHEHSHEETGFFGWLQDDDSCSANVAMFISEELYPNAGKYYAGEGEIDSEADYEDSEEDEIME